MRILLGLAIAVVLAVTAWSTNPTVGKTNGVVSIDPFGLTMTTTNLLSEQHYDQGTIF